MGEQAQKPVPIPRKPQETLSFPAQRPRSQEKIPITRPWGTWGPLLRQRLTWIRINLGHDESALAASYIFQPFQRNSARMLPNFNPFDHCFLKKDIKYPN